MNHCRVYVDEFSNLTWNAEIDSVRDSKICYSKVSVRYHRLQNTGGICLEHDMHKNF